MSAEQYALIYDHGLNADCQVGVFDVDLADFDTVTVWNFYGPTLHDIVGIDRTSGRLGLTAGALFDAPRLQSLGAADGGALFLDSGF